MKPINVDRYFPCWADVMNHDFTTDPVLASVVELLYREGYNSFISRWSNETKIAVLEDRILILEQKLAELSKVNKNETET